MASRKCNETRRHRGGIAGSGPAGLPALTCHGCGWVGWDADLLDAPPVDGDPGMEGVLCPSCRSEEVYPLPALKTAPAPVLARSGGIGGVAPDVNLSRPTYLAHCGTASLGRPGAVAAASPPSPCPVAAVDLAQPEPRGAASDNALPALAPDKPVLCGQPPRGDYLAHGGKSFTPIMSMQKCTSYEVKSPRRPPGHVVQSSVERSRKLRAMYRSLGWSRAGCAKHLHVTERCLRNREAGSHAIPFAAFRLLRISLVLSGLRAVRQSPLSARPLLLL